MSDDKEIVSAIHSQLEDLVLLAKEHGVLIQYVTVDWTEFNHIDGKFTAMLAGVRVETKMYPLTRRDHE